jgi:nucleoid-associated protein YgaU
MTMRIRIHAARALIAMVVPMLAACGGGPPTSRPAYDLGRGQYLTPEQYADLSKDEAKAYCDDLASELDILNDNAAVSAERAPELEQEVAALEAQVAQGRDGRIALASEVANLEARLAALTARPATYTVKKDDWLMKIARSSATYSDGGKWKRIYDANGDKITNPDLIYPGQVLSIPR